MLGSFTISSPRATGASIMIGGQLVRRTRYSCSLCNRLRIPSFYNSMQRYAHYYGSSVDRALGTGIATGARQT